MIILIIQLIALAFLILAVISISWLLFINRALNSKYLILRWQEKAVGKSRAASWGKIFESVTYKPIAGAVVKIFDAESKELLDKTVSDKEGSFGFEVPDGKFYLTVNSFYHSFPSQTLLKIHKPELYRRRQDNSDYFGLFLPEIHDRGFENLYFGEVINNCGRNMQRIFASRAQLLNKIEEKIPLILNIPLDKEEILTLDEATLELIKKQETAFKRIKTTALFLGFGLTSFCLLSKPNLFSFIILELFLIFCLFSLFSQIRPKYEGIITDNKGKPINLSLIRARGYRTKKIRATAITDAGGHFEFQLCPGWYTFEVSHYRFATEKRLIKCEGKTDVDKFTFKLNKNLP